MLKKAIENIKYRNNIKHDENQYLNLINDILEDNQIFDSRNGETIAIFGSAMHFSLNDNTIPFITTKKLAWKTCLKELLWFISGNTSNTTLNKQNVHIWDLNSTREFLDSRGLFNREINDLGPIYGFQWRHFNADYINSSTDYTNKGIDQLNNIIYDLKNNKNSRRLIMTSWNPSQIQQMALPPCHILCQFNVNNNLLSCSLYQRSGDIGLGVPFNIASYSLLTHLLAHHCNLIPHEFIYFLGNAHIYTQHKEGLKEQLKRNPYTFPKIQILNKYDNIEDYKIDDFFIKDYNFHENIKLILC